MDKALLNKVETLVDDKYLSFELPHIDWTLTAWYILMSMEEHQIWMFRSAAEDESLNRKLEYVVDSLKYSLKHALLRARSEATTDSNHEVPRKSIPLLYSRASKIIQAGIDYHTATQIISSVYDKKVKLISLSDTIKLDVLDDIYHSIPYSVLEMIGHIEPETITYSLIFYAMLKSPKDFEPVLSLISEPVSLKNRILRYEYNPLFAHHLALTLSQQPFLIPDDWCFEWGGRQETTLLLNALAIRCMYHLVAVEFGARKYKLKGGGEDSLVLILTRKQLISDLVEMSSMEESIIGIFVDNLIYGHGVDFPDPALQPLIKLSKGQIALPCLHIISSHLERNLLTLQARQNPRLFDSQSKLFEIKMTEDLLSKIKYRWPVNKTNAHITLANTTEELDLILVDTASKSIFIGELRWILPPGDPREVQNKKKACNEKVNQLQRKINWAKENLNELLKKAFEIDHEPTWEVYGAVIIEGFGGARSTDDNIPVIVKYIAELGLLNAVTIRHFGQWSRSLAWIPQEGVHYEKGHDRIETNEEPIEFSTSSILCTPEEYREFLVESLRNVAHEKEVFAD